MYYSDDSLEFPITVKMRQTAQQLAMFQPTPEKRAQVENNLLAVQAVNFYLQMLGIDTHLGQGDCWNPAGQLAADVADLCLANGQRLECRAVLPGATHCAVPPEVWQNRLGYVVVALETRSAHILGFVSAIATPLVSLQRLLPLDALLVQLHRHPLIQLGDWLHQQFTPSLEQGWLTVTDFVQGRLQETAMAFRSRSLNLKFSAFDQTKGHHQIEGKGIHDPSEPSHDLQEHVRLHMRQLYTNERNMPLPDEFLTDPKLGLVEIICTTQADEESRWQAADMLWSLEPDYREVGIRRLLDLGMQFAGQSVALMVGLLPRPDGNRAVLLRLYPMVRGHLPPGIELVGCDDRGETFLRAQARPVDDYIQIKFAAQPGEFFSIQVLLDGVGITESFSA